MLVEEICKQLEREDRVKEYFYVTDLGKCPRKVIMDFGDFKKKPLTESELLMFKFADYIHERVTSLLRKSDRFVVAANELSLNGGLPNFWHGRCDALLFDLHDRIFIPLEIKSTRAFRYTSDFPKPEHIMQINAYMFALITMGYDTQRGIILYVDRSGSNKPLEFKIPYDENILHEFKKYEELYKKHFETELTLPPVMAREIKKVRNTLYLVPSWQCDYCHYQGLSCNPNMSKNKLGELTKEGFKKSRDYGKFADEIDQNKLNKFIKPEEIENFGEYVKAVSD